MRIALKVNGTQRLVAGMHGPGYLSAHLNLHDRPKEDEHSKVVRIEGTRTLETETVHLSWPEIELQVGDTAELEVLKDGESDAPTEIRRSSESPDNLLSDAELAREVLTATSAFESQLMKLLRKSRDTEAEDEHKKFALAVGHVLFQLGDNLLYPIYRRHKELVPDQARGEIL